ncbi:helix-turn-helix transcriptional regulator [Actinokineospora sp. HUAS TT18]|uniref:helix-turn-helix transcriptional regulator n=1 Tax=Actinokineospora sp. HUAS TT18 TaxID=3447451 RepID=UPI003F521CD9
MFLLEPVGLGENENEVYFALLETPRASATLLSKQTGLAVDDVDAAMTRLLGNGLIQQLSFSPATYVVAAPEEALSALIHRRRGDLAKMQVMVEEIAERYRADTTPANADEPLVELIEGEEAVLAAIARIQVNARKELLGIDAPPYIGGQTSPNDIELTQLARGVSYRFIYAPEALTRPEDIEQLRMCVDAGEEARILPNLTMKLSIADRSVALMPASYQDPDPTRRLLVRSSALIDVLVSYWETVWAKATPAIVSGAPEGGLGERDRELLSLLASGMKDRAIARAMGVTERTIGRRLTELMNELGAETRFQAGVQAAHRGWL